jgi:hypothetical protein
VKTATNPVIKREIKERARKIMRIFVLTLSFGIRGPGEVMGWRREDIHGTWIMRCRENSYPDLLQVAKWESRPGVIRWF